MRHGGPTLATYLAVLRRRIWIVVLCLVLVPVAATYFSVRQAATYESSADVYINKQNLASALTGIEVTPPFASEERAVETEVGLASLPEVARGALRIARVEDRSAEDLLDQSSVTAKGRTDILRFAVADPDPKIAERLATAYAQAFTGYRGRLDTQSLVRAHREVSAVLEKMRAEGRQAVPLYESLEQNRQQLQTLQTLQTARASVVRRAGKAVQIRPQPVRNAILGVVLGLILGLVLAFLIEALDTRIRSAGEVGERLGLPLLARLPAPPKKLQRNDGLVMMDRPGDARAEAFRMLRTNLEFATLDSDVRSLLVTSAAEGEGKSTTAANLSVTMARAGKRVVLVDLDLRRPYLDRFFSLTGPGVTNVALGNADLGDALTSIDLDETSGDLHVLASGPLPPDPGEFVGTHQLGDVLFRLREQFDVVVIDCPPLLHVVDAMRLSPYVDGILIVTQLNLVRRRMLSEMRQVLDSIPARKLGFVVTGAQREEGGSYVYGYGRPYAQTERESAGTSGWT